MNQRAGATASATRVSSGDSHAMITEGDHEEQDVADGHRQHEEQALDQLEVAGGAADDLAGGQLVLPPPVEPGDGVVHLGAQVVLDVEGEPAAVVAADVGERRRRRAAAAISRPAQRREGAVSCRRSRRR